MSSLSHANYAPASRMSSVPGRQTGRQQTLPAGPCLPLQTLTEHTPTGTRVYAHIREDPPHTHTHPKCTPLLDNCSDSNGLKMTLFSHNLHPPALSFSRLLLSFQAGWKASQTPTPCTYHSGQDTQEVYVLHRTEREGKGEGRVVGGRGEWWRKGERKGGGERRGKCKSCEAHEN